MAKSRQTRRSISVKGITYQWIFDYCQGQDPPLSISGFIENVTQGYLEKSGVPKPQVLKERPREKKKVHEYDPPRGNHFTF